MSRVVHGKMTDELDEITQTQLKDEIPQGRFVQTKELRQRWDIY